MVGRPNPLTRTAADDLLEQTPERVEEQEDEGGHQDEAAFYPIRTVGSPTADPAPQPQVSEVLMAGLPPMSTVLLPDENGVGG